MFLNLEGGITRGPLPNAKDQKDSGTGSRSGNQKKNRDRGQNDRQEQTSERGRKYLEKIEAKRRELRTVKAEARAANEAEKRDEVQFLSYREEKKIRKRKKRKVAQEIFQLRRELRTAKKGWSRGEPVTGALPDFAVIGVGKGGTTHLYHLLSQHPHIEPAASKELHFFDKEFDKGIEWYRQNFPTPRRKGGRMTITGEATPYLADPRAPERMARVVPQARLIALLRNPVDRAYSRYHQQVRKGLATVTFEEAIEEEMAWLREASQPGEHRTGADDVPFAAQYQCIYKGIYVDHLMRWAEFFDREQMLVLKSEDFFARTQETLDRIFEFLGLPKWELKPSEFERKRNTRRYEKMDLETRRRLQEYFEPHNRRLYDYLGVDFGWQG